MCNCLNHLLIKKYRTYIDISFRLKGYSYELPVCLKTRLDKFLHAQEAYYNWEADITETGDLRNEFKSLI